MGKKNKESKWTPQNIISIITALTGLLTALYQIISLFVAPRLKSTNFVLKAVPAKNASQSIILLWFIIFIISVVVLIYLLKYKKIRKVINISLYASIATFGGVSFYISDMNPSTQPSTLKTNIGKAFIEKSIPMRNTTDIVLQITGLITGLSKTPAQTYSEAIEVDRAALILLDDGDQHAYSDGKHSGNFVIKTGSLRWEDVADRAAGEPNKFTMEIVQWQ